MDTSKQQDLIKEIIKAAIIAVIAFILDYMYENFIKK